MAQSFDDLFDDPGPPAHAETDPKQVALRHAPRWARLYSIADTLANECHALFKRDWLRYYDPRDNPPNWESMNRILKEP